MYNDPFDPGFPKYITATAIYDGLSELMRCGEKYRIGEMFQNVSYENQDFYYYEKGSEHNNSLVVLDLFNSRKYKNANLTIMGTSGSGKSFTMQILATRLRLKQVQVFIIAPLKGHEFVRSTKAGTC